MAQAAFSTLELKRQVEFFDRADAGRRLYNGIAHRFADRGTNFAPGLHPVADAYFAGDEQRAAITWHTHSNHALSSQVCCLNFLMPIATDRDRAARFLGAALAIDPPDVLPVETAADGRDWFIAFEWTGAGNYLREQIGDKPLQRGSNSTSADAYMAFRQDGQKHAVLIEWRYTEAYGPALSNRQRPDGTGGNATRRNRYGDLAFAPGGPIRNDLGLELEDFFWEPFYQLLRQQMLAYQLERHHDADTARVLHLSPRGNLALHRVTAPKLRPFGTDAFDVFRHVLVHPDRFICRRIEDVFGPLLANRATDDPWRSYLLSRYRFLSD